MKCDKCGFEHNSRSVCPKCGARVVYVNEDYLRRKKEWEEAQKKGQQGGALPGITYSTREDYDRKRGRDTVTGSGRISGQNEEGRHEDAGLPFDDIKEWVKKTRVRLAALWGRRKKRRGADNPVIREINFNTDEDRENYDDTELVKIRRRTPTRVKPVFFAAAATVVLLALGAVIALGLMKEKNSDKGRVFIYDGKSGFFVGEENEPLIEGVSGRLEVAAVGKNFFIAHDDGALYVYADGKIRKTEAESPRIIAYNEAVSLVVYESGERAHILTDENDTELELYKRGDFTDACSVSDSGGYFVLTTCEGGDDFTPGEYTVYFGDRNGKLREIMRDYNEKEIIRLRDDGSLVFSDMATADYGIINGRTLSVWENGTDSIRTVIGDISGLRYDRAKETVYCLNADGELYGWGINEINPVPVDGGVYALCGNAAYDTQGGIIYRKEDGFYLCDGGKIRYLFDAECVSPEFYFDYSQNYLYYRDTGTIYYSAVGEKNSEPESVCTLKSADSLLYYPQGKSVLAIAADGALWELGASQKRLEEGASRVMAVENDGGIAYCIDGRLMYRAYGKNAAELFGGTGNFDSIVFSRNKIYFRGGDKTAYRVSEDGSGIENIGYAEYLFFTE